MPSPFPGMDPYLEDPAHWRGVHAALIVGCYEALNAVLPDGFIARIEERVYLSAVEQSIYPDIAVGRRSDARPTGVVMTAPHPTDAPLRVRTAVDEVRERFLAIVSLSEPEQVVTAIEVLSPANKIPGDGRDEYRRKQARCLRSGTHLLEIDLLRTGRYTVAASESDVRSQVGHWDYVVSLHRAGDGWECDTWPRTVREPLPVVPVPLTAPNPDVWLDLPAVLTRVYDAGPFRKSIDYAAEPIPPLLPDDARWAGDLLRQAGRIR